MGVYLRKVMKAGPKGQPDNVLGHLQLRPLCQLQRPFLLCANR